MEQRKIKFGIVDGCGAEHLCVPTLEVYEIEEKAVEALFQKYENMLEVARIIAKQNEPIKIVEFDYLIPI